MAAADRADDSRCGAPHIVGEFATEDRAEHAAAGGAAVTRLAAHLDFANRLHDAAVAARVDDRGARRSRADRRGGWRRRAQRSRREPTRAQHQRLFEHGARDALAERQVGADAAVRRDPVTRRNGVHAFVDAGLRLLQHQRAIDAGDLQRRRPTRRAIEGEAQRRAGAQLGDLLDVEPVDSRRNADRCGERRHGHPQRRQHADPPVAQGHHPELLDVNVRRTPRAGQSRPFAEDSVQRCQDNATSSPRPTGNPPKVQPLAWLTRACGCFTYGNVQRRHDGLTSSRSRTYRARRAWRRTGPHRPWRSDRCPTPHRDRRTRHRCCS